MSEDRLSRQLAFVLEVDALKSVLRRTYHTRDDGREDSAQHSWHLAVMALLLAEHAEPAVDVAHVVRMVLFHDLVEIDAGDTFAYDAAGHADKEAREQAAAERLFAIPPADQGVSLRALWDEFEGQQTPESRFALAIDRLAAIMLNAHTGGISWKEHGVTAAQVMERLEPARLAAPALWEHGRELVRRGVAEETIRP